MRYPRGYSARKLCRIWLGLALPLQEPPPWDWRFHGSASMVELNSSRPKSSAFLDVQESFVQRRWHRNSPERYSTYHRLCHIVRKIATILQEKVSSQQTRLPGSDIYGYTNSSWSGFCVGEIIPQRINNRCFTGLHEQKARVT